MQGGLATAMWCMEEIASSSRKAIGGRATLGRLLDGKRKAGVIVAPLGVVRVQFGSPAWMLRGS